MAVDKLNNAVEETSVLEKEVMLQFDTMAQLQKDERLELQRLFAEERADIRKHYGKIVLTLSILLLLIIGSLVGGAVYLLSTFDFDFRPYYSQDVSAEGGGNSTIEDGIKINQPPLTE